MKFSLRPVVFQKLTRIGTLFAEEKKPEKHFKDKMLKKLRNSLYHGQVKLITYLGAQNGTAAILLPNKLLFWPENQPEKRNTFDLLGCENHGL